MRVGAALAASLVLALGLPIVALVGSISWAALVAGLSHPLFLPALGLSLRTTALSLLLLVLTGTPLAWWLASSGSRWVRGVELVVELPLVMPPVVLGVALLHTFGRRGLLGPWLEGLGVVVPFTEAAVVLAQVVVSAPLYVAAARNAFARVEPDLLIVARTLGASPVVAFFRVAVPVALPGLLVGATLAWARALGELGATLLFAGSLAGRTQTMPLAILSALESDVQLAVVFSLVLAAIAAVLLVLMRQAPAGWARLGVGG